MVNAIILIIVHGQLWQKKINNKIKNCWHSNKQKKKIKSNEWFRWPATPLALFDGCIWSHSPQSDINNNVNKFSKLLICHRNNIMNVMYACGFFQRKSFNYYGHDNWIKNVEYKKVSNEFITWIIYIIFNMGFLF